MSLINDMLKDLDSRHEAGSYPQGVMLAGVGLRRPSLSARRGRHYAAGVLGACAVLLIAGVATHFHGTPRVPASGRPTSVAALAVAGDKAAASRTPPAAPAQTPRADAAATTPAGGAVPASATVQEAAVAGPATADKVPAPARPIAHRDGQTDHDGPSSAAHHAHPAASAEDREPAPAAPVRLKKVIHPLSPTERAARLRREALALARDGKLDGAEEKVIEALSIAPADVASRELLAGLMIKAGRLQQAAAQLDRGLKLNPGAARLVELRARVYLMRGDTDRARLLLEANAPGVTQDPEYHALLAAVYQRLGDYAKAGDLYRVLVTQRPQNGIWWLGLGLSLEATGKNAQARLAYEKAQATRALSPQLRRFIREKLSSAS